MSATMLTTGVDGGGGGGGSGGEQHRAIDTAIKFKIQENPYSNNVLVGNWFEERFADKSDKKAITPCIYGQSDCVREQPLYKRDYTAPHPANAVAGDNSQKDSQDFVEWKLKGFRNRLSSEESNIKLWDGNEFERNATTIKDLMFRIVPERKMMKGADDKDKQKGDEDLLRSYGNATKTGLLQWRACEEWQERRTPIDVSNYKNTFKAPVVREKRVLCKGPKKKTSLV